MTEYALPYVGNANYTGPYLSDGKIQESVAFGEEEPASQLDALSRLHDTAYATYKDFGHLTAADSIYNEEAKKLESKFPQLAGQIVLYGNAIQRFGSNLAAGAAAGPVSFVAAAVHNFLDIHDYMLHEKEYRRDVLALYELDPMKPKKWVQEKHLGESVEYAGMFQTSTASTVMLDWKPYEEKRPLQQYGSVAENTNPVWYRRRDRRRRRRKRKQ